MKNFTFGIVGLHPCGDLGATLIKLFLSCKQAKFLNIVGCCYMKLTTKRTGERVPTGYPLSEFLRISSNKPVSHLSYEAREISCHATEVYTERLANGNYNDLKIHSFRAAAERVLTKRWPELKHVGLRSVKHSNGMTFEE